MAPVAFEARFPTQRPIVSVKLSASLCRDQLPGKGRLMPQSIMIGLLVLGGVLLLIAITGGNFKIFDAEVDSPVKSAPVRIFSGTLGLLFIAGALLLNKTGAPAPANAPAGSSSAGTPAAMSNPSPGSSSALPAGSGITPAAQPVAGGGQQAQDIGSGASNPAVSSSEYAIVFDPPTNVRVGPSTGSKVLCSVTAKTTIRILGSEGNWYQTDVCGNGQMGYIYRNQVKF